MAQRPVNGKSVDPVQIVREICAGPGTTTFVRRLRARLAKEGISDAVKDHRSDLLFNWLVHGLSYQGVSDAVVDSFISKHGNVTFTEITSKLENQNSDWCPKLVEFSKYIDCGYRKGANSCANSKALYRCPVPSHALRKGQLNQMAYSLFLFIRDICHGDLVSFIDQTLANADQPGHPDRLAFMGQALTQDLLKVFGISNKVINMCFADLLLGIKSKNRRWKEVGASMVAIDTLVHNFLHRTGILHRYDAAHSFGETCYGPNGCALIVDDLARQVDCSKFGRGYPIYFPRLIQHAIWRFCAEAGQSECNGRVINDHERCDRKDCPVFSRCGRLALKPA